MSLLSNIPASGSHQGKLWGETQLVFCYNGVECHNLSIVKSGYCSIHKHESKWNRFLVISGMLEVNQWSINTTNMSSPPDKTVLEAGEICDVPPGIFHQFKALYESQVMEMYWTVLDTDDIARLTVGGVENQ